MTVLASGAAVAVDVGEPADQIERDIEAVDAQGVDDRRHRQGQDHGAAHPFRRA